MNLVDQIFEQARIGTHLPISSAFATGVQAGQNQQRIDMQKQELAQELAFAPLKQTLLQQDAQMNALKLESGLRDRQNLIDTESDFAGLANAVTHAMQEADPVDVNPLFFSAVANRPRLAETERFQSLWKDYNTSLNAKLALRSGQGFTPQEILVPSSVPGQPPTRVLQTSPNQVTPVPGSTPPAPSSAQKNFQEIRALQQTLRAAIASGDPAAIAEAQSDLATFGAMASTPTQTVYDRETGNPIFTSGKATGDLTVGSRTRMQAQEMSGSEAMQALDSAIKGITANPNAIGIRGKIGGAIEQARGQMSPNEPLATPLTDTRQKASIAFSRIAPALRVDSGNMSKYELNKLEQAGDVLSVEEAPQTALTKLRNLQAVVVARQLRVLKAQGKPIDDSTLRAVDGAEIAGLLQSGLLSQEDALRLYRLTKPAK